MTAQEKGFLLLCSRLGNPERRVLTAHQLRTLAQRIRGREVPLEDRELTRADLLQLGYSRDFADRIVALLSEEDILEYYLNQAKSQGCQPITRVSEDYPLLLRKRLGLESPGCLWAKGDLDLLKAPAIALVGSRELREENRTFAAAVGRHAARKGLVLISGNARGADRTAQKACLEAGGSVISVVADQLNRQRTADRVLYLSEEAFDEPFSISRALSRNRCIHAMGQMVFVAQCDLGKGGTWDGTSKNLHHGWSPVACFRDGGEASRELEQMGAFLITAEDLEEVSALPEPELSLF